MIAAPPVDTGAVHERSIRVWPLAVAVRPVGAPGAEGEAEVVVVVLAVVEVRLRPTELMAKAR